VPTLSYNVSGNFVTLNAVNLDSNRAFIRDWNRLAFSLLSPQLAILVLLQLAGWVSFRAQAQCLQSIAGLGDSLCMGEEIQFTLPSTASNANWDLCSGDWMNGFDADLVGNLTSTLNTPRSISMVEDGGDWYGFVVNSSLSSLHRLAFTNGIDQDPTSITQLQFTGGAGSITSSTWSRIKFIQEAGTWHGLGITEANVLSRITFSGSAGLASDTVDLSTFSNTFGLNNARDIDLIVKNDSIFLVVINRVSSELKVLSFGTSVMNTPTLYATHSLPGFATPQSVDITHQCGKYFGLITSLTDAKVGVLKFGNDLSELISVEALNTGASFPLPMKVFLKRELGKWIGIVKNRNNSIELSRIYFNDTLSATPDSVVQLGSLSGAMVGWALDLVKEGTQSYAFGVNIVSGNATYRLNFDNSCPVDSSVLFLDYPDTSTAVLSSGKYAVELNYQEVATGQWNAVYQPLWIKEGTHIDLNLNEGCAGDTVTLSDLSTSNVPITGRTWVVNGFGTFTDSIVHVQPLLPDTFSVSLEVTNQEGCVDSLDTFFVSHPFPDLNVSIDSTCLGQQLELTNSSAILFDSIAAWTWTFPDTSILNQFTPTYIPADSGLFAVTLSASSTFGCQVSDSINYYVKDAPVAHLSVTKTCFGDQTALDNLSSSSSAFTTFWALGDGNTSSLPSLNHSYQDTGSYVVELVVSATNGCVDSASQVVFISNPPVINSFGFTDTRCSHQLLPVEQVFFSDSLSETLWLVNGVLSDTVLFPQLLISDTGAVDIDFIVNSGTSCYDTLSRDVYINPSPRIDISISSRCASDSSVITSLFANEPTIVFSSWVDQEFDTVFSDMYTLPFMAAGDYFVWHSLVSDSSCVNDTQLLINKVSRPQIDLQLSSSEWCTDSILSYTNSITLDATDSLVGGAVYFYENGILSDSAMLEIGEFSFHSAGLKSLQLRTSTSAGCRDSIERFVDVSSSPRLDLQLDTTCVFATKSFAAPYEGSNYSFLWRMGDGVSYAQSTPNHTFTNQGLFRGSLLVRDNVSGCFTRDTLNTQVLAAPSLELIVDSFCTSAPILLEAAFEDGIQYAVSQNWSDNSSNYINVNPVILEGKGAGVYSISASFTSQYECQVLEDFIYTVIPPPTLNASVDRSFGAVPASPVFTLSTGEAVVDLGLIAEGDTLSGNRLSIDILEPKIFDVQAFAVNTIGCVSEQTFRLNFSNPREDAALRALRYEEVNGVQSVLVDVFNTGTAPIEHVEVQLRNYPAFSLVYQDSIELLPGERETIAFTGLVFGSPPDAYCAEVLTVNGRFDTITANNEVCLNGGEQPLLITYPNPFASEISVVVYASQCNELDLVVVNLLGDVVHSEILQTQEGTTFRKLLNLSQISSGVYIIAVYCGDDMSYRRVVKR
jgi:PKD repeat protein